MNTRDLFILSVSAGAPLALLSWVRGFRSRRSLVRQECRRKARRKSAERKSKVLHDEKLDNARLSLARIHAFNPKANPSELFAILRAMDPLVFEEIVLLELHRRGLKIRRSKRYTGDGGIDGEFWIGNQRFLVQAKRYSGAINPDHIYQFDMVCEKHNALGIFIHTGVTPRSARAKIAKARRLSILSGDGLVEFFGGAKLSFTSGPKFNERAA